MPFSISELSFPVWTFLLIYGFFLLWYVIYGLFNLVHLLEYGRVSPQLFTIVIGFIGGSVLILAVSWIWLFHYDLTYSVPFSDAINTFKQTFLHTGLY